MSHLNVSGDGEALSGSVVFEVFGARLLLNSCPSALKLTLWLTGAEFLNSILSPTRAATTRGMNWQHGWSTAIVFGAAFSSFGWILSCGNGARRSVLSGRSQTTTFFTPLPF